jgi:putative transposase
MNWMERKQVAGDLKEIYRAATAAQAAMELNMFQARWGTKYQAIGKLWEENWERITPFFEFPAEVRKVIYTTNAVELLHMSLRKIMALRNVIQKWDTVQGWKQALNHFQMLWATALRQL